MIKVYCGKCRWYKWYHSQLGIEQIYYQPARDECNYPFGYIVIDTYRSPRLQKREPKTLNAENDCDWYEVKPVKPSIWNRIYNWLVPGHGIPSLKAEDIPPMPPVKPPRIDITECLEVKE